MPMLTEKGGFNKEIVNLLCPLPNRVPLFHRALCFRDKCSELAEVCVIDLPFKIAFLKLPPLRLLVCSPPTPAENHELSPCYLTRARTSSPLDHTRTQILGRVLI